MIFVVKLILIIRVLQPLNDVKMNRVHHNLQYWKGCRKQPYLGTEYTRNIQWISIIFYDNIHFVTSKLLKAKKETKQNFFFSL